LAHLCRVRFDRGQVLGRFDADRAAEVCRQMLAYAGRAQPTGSRADLAACASEVCAALARTAGGAIRIEPAEHLPAIKADPAQVRQVVQNARDEVVAGASDAGFHLAPPAGRYVVLTVSDTGPGMTPDVRDRMFDPFFSTKFTGRGLGLAAVLGIARAHKGGILVSTLPGRGTAVAVYWPELTSPVTPAVLPPPPPPVVALVIEDEPFAREVIAGALEDAGFAPLLATDSAAGLELFRANRARVGLAVVTPRALPALRSAAPDLPVVLVSAERTVPAADARTAFIQKPFHPDALLALVRKLV
jgi:two-component system, cell cycle sensor histidine kinase and response regulator CckA